MLGLPDVPNSTEHISKSEAESQAPLPPLKPLQGAAPSSELTPLQFNPHSPKERSGLGRTILQRQAK